ncbi:DUF6461 domain-containing protein [Microbispora hainanensis]|uniref:DUF6461 domain-containing protein n=1 Tax=Microbispora hainanensis TaxID=568844 RepID=UPI003248CA9C
MAADEMRAHYLRFLESHQWLANALTWTVVHPWAETPPPVDVVASRLTGGGSPEIAELWIRETDLYPMEVVFAGASGPSMMLLEANGAYTSGPDVIRRLSVDARVWSLSWHVNGGERLTCAAGGEILAVVPGLDPALMTGPRPEAVADAIGPLRDAVASRPVTTRAEAWALKTAAMAVMESSTGARLTAEWVGDMRQAILIDPPLSAPLERRGFGHVEPDLDARLRHAPEAVRRAALLLPARDLTGRFGLDEPPIEDAIDVVAGGGALGEELRWGLLETQLQLHDGWVPVIPEGDDPDRAERLRAAAVVAVRLALLEAAGRAENFEALTCARWVLGDEWPSLRSAVEDLLTDAG